MLFDPDNSRNILLQIEVILNIGITIYIYIYIYICVCYFIQIKYFCLDFYS